MKKTYLAVFALLLVLASCRDETENLFDKSADERVAEAKRNLKNELLAPENGWKVKYQPEEGSGSYWVLLNFFEDDKLVVRTDLGAENGEYFSDTLTYRIDNSIGLELIFETYSFFSYLFEQNQATFFAEYEFRYANKTPEGFLVFTSKSDPGTPTVLLFQPAEADDESLLGREVATNLNTIASDIGSLVFSSPGYKLTYENKDLVLYLAMSDVTRTIDITGSSKKTTQTGAQSINFSTGFYLRGDSLVLHEPLTGTFQGVNVSLKGIKFTDLSITTIDLCGGRDVNAYEGVTSQNDQVLLEATLDSPAGAAFSNYSFLVSPLEYIFDNGENVGNEITADITGAGAMQLYYNFDGGFYGLGFFIQNADGTNTFALYEFTPQLIGNKIMFEFEPEISVFGNQSTPADLDNVKKYIDALTEGDQTYAFDLGDGVFELHNPCTGWSAAFIGIE
jgi:hypothetical protein